MEMDLPGSEVWEWDQWLRG